MRVSDDTREHTIAALRGGCVAGYLSPETLEWRVGRALEARTRPELTLHEPSVSRRHAEVHCVGRTFVLSDLHSSNGT